MEEEDEFFIKYAKHFQMPDVDKYPVVHATFEQNEEQLATLMKEANNPNEQTEDGISALWCACYVGGTACLSILLKAKADPNIADPVGQTPLFVAAYQSSEENVRILLENNSKLYHQDIEGRTALHAASDAGNAKIISLLLEYDKEEENNGSSSFVDIGDKDNRSALHYAACSNQCDCVDSLISGGANVDFVDVNLSTPLHVASEIGHDYVVDILIDDNANMEALDNQGRTALHIACTEGKGYCVDLLIANGAKIMNLDGKGLSPLHLAVLNVQAEIVKLLLDGAEVETFDENGNPLPPFHNRAHPNVLDLQGRTCMHAVAELGDVVLCDLLYQRGTDLHLKDRDGHSPLHYCGMWSQPGCVDWFLLKDIKVDCLDNMKRTCLHYACYFGNYQVVHTLLRRNADVNAQDVNGDTPLLCALHEYDNNDKSEIIQLLLEYGADTLQTNEYKRNSFHVCACTGDLETLELLLEHCCNDESNWAEDQDIESAIPDLLNQGDRFGVTPVHMAAANSQYDVLESLIHQRGNPNITDHFGNTALHWACKSGSIDCIDILIHQFRANALEKDSYGQTCLTIAAYAGAKDCIRSLLEVGLSPMDRDRHGKTPLHGAAYNGHTVILNMFLGCDNVDLNYVCNQGRTALHRAAARGHLEIVSILLSNGAIVDPVDENGITPLMLAHYYCHPDVIEALMNDGADSDRKDSLDRLCSYYAESGKNRLGPAPDVPPTPPFFTSAIPAPVAGESSRSDHIGIVAGSVTIVSQDVNLNEDSSSDVSSGSPPVVIHSASLDYLSSADVITTPDDSTEDEISEGSEEKGLVLLPLEPEGIIEPALLLPLEPEKEEEEEEEEEEIPSNQNNKTIPEEAKREEQEQKQEQKQEQEQEREQKQEQEQEQEQKQEQAVTEEKEIIPARIPTPIPDVISVTNSEEEKASVVDASVVDASVADAVLAPDADPVPTPVVAVKEEKKKEEIKVEVAPVPVPVVVVPVEESKEENAWLEKAAQDMKANNGQVDNGRQRAPLPSTVTMIEEEKEETQGEQRNTVMGRISAFVLSLFNPILLMFMGRPE